MEENYNSLGIFSGLSSVKAVKKLALPPTTETVSSEVEPDFDLFSHIEKSVGLGKPKEGIISKKGSPSKVLKTPESEEGEVQANKQEVANAEKSAESYAKEFSIEQSTSCSNRASIDAVQPNVPSTSKRKTRNSNKRNSLNTTSTNNQINSNPMSRGGRRRGRAKSVGTSRDISDDQQFNQNQSLFAAIIEGAQSFGVLPTLRTHRDVMRARRNYVAEIAARCTTVDVVDLISSPMPRVEGVIDVTVDSDEEENKPSTSIEPKLLETSFDEDNPEMSVKIMWQGLVESFTLRKYQKFQSIFEKLSENFGIEKTNVFLNLDNKIISQDDTPASINYKIFQVIYGRSMADSKFLNASTLGKKNRDPNLLKLKVQSDKWKQPLTIELHKTDKFKKLMIKCAEELKMPLQKIKLSFDGEPLLCDQTPMDLEFEGGEVLEIHLNNKT